MWKEDSMCDPKYQWGCDKSVARMWLWKLRTLVCVCNGGLKSVWNSYSAVLPVVPEYCVQGVKKSNHPIQTPSHKSPLRVKIYSWVAVISNQDVWLDKCSILLEILLPTTCMVHPAFDSASSEIFFKAIKAQIYNLYSVPCLMRISMARFLCTIRMLLPW
jgi:hypothetical protein